MLKKGKRTEVEEEHQEARPRREAAGESISTWTQGGTAALDQTTTLKMEVETEGRVEKTAETKMWKGLKLGLKRESGERARAEMDLLLEGGANSSREVIKIHTMQGPGLKSPCPDRSRKQFQRINQTPGSKRRVHRSSVDFIGTLKVQQSRRGMEDSGLVLLPSLTAPLTPRTRGRWPEQTDSLLHLESHCLSKFCRDTGRPAVPTSSHRGTAARSTSL